MGEKKYGGQIPSVYIYTHLTAVDMSMSRAAIMACRIINFRARMASLQPIGYGAIG